jgi:uncharacterized membrane protein AbrB (regulator of aidB expression)
MPRVSAAFFAVGVICVAIGMFWGMHMGITHDFTEAPAHAHLNLVGWVTMALYGTFYALTRETMSRILAWTNFFVSVAGGLIMVPALAMFLANGNDQKYVPFMSAGEGLTLLGLIIFAISVYRELARRR